MKISIIVPVYKVEKYIRDCIESVINQDYPEIEVILVDDASPDGSMVVAGDILAQSQRQDMFRIITHPHNRGLSAARNSGIDAATGDYLYFLDSDDTLASDDSISVLVNAVSGCDVAIGNYRGVKADSSYVSKYSVGCMLQGDDLIRAFVRGDVPITAWNKLIARRYFDHGLRFKEGILNEDELFSYQLLFRNPKVAMAGIVTYNYSIRPGSIMTTFNLQRFLSPIIVYEEAAGEYARLGGANPIILNNLDHFAFKRHVAVMISQADDDDKYSLYTRLRKAQRKMKGVGKMRYVYNCHLYLPAPLGFRVMRLVAGRYAASRHLK